MSTNEKQEEVKEPKQKKLQTYYRLSSGQIIKAEEGRGFLLPRKEFVAKKTSKYMPHIGEKHRKKLEAQKEQTP